MKKIACIFAGCLLAAGAASAALVTHFEDDFSAAVDPSNSSKAANTWYTIGENAANSVASIDTNGDIGAGALRIGFGFDAVETRLYLDQTWDDTRTYTVSFDWGVVDVLDITPGFSASVVGVTATDGLVGTIDSDLEVAKDAADLATGHISFEITAADLITAGVDTDDYIGLHFDKVGAFSPNRTSVYTIDNVSVTSIPEPATLGLISAFGAGLLFVRRRLMM